MSKLNSWFRKTEVNTRNSAKARSEPQLNKIPCRMPIFHHDKETINQVYSCPYLTKTNPSATKKRRSRAGYNKPECSQKLCPQAVTKVKDLPSQKQMWKKFNDAACVIQRAFKRYVVLRKWRETIQRARKIADDEKRFKIYKSALIIQRWWRKKLARRKMRQAKLLKRRNAAIAKRSFGLTQNHLYNSKSHLRTIHHSAKEYTVPGSLFFHDWEAVLVIGGITPPLSHYGFNSGKECLSKDQLASQGSEILRFNPGVNEWESTKFFLPEGRHHHSCAFLGGLIYIVGGCSVKEENEVKRKQSASKQSRGGAVVGTTWAIDPVTGLWEELQSLTTPRRDFALIATNGSLYAIGGMDRSGLILSSVERYNPSKARWTFVAPMPEPRVGHAAAKHHDHIWVTGGNLAPSPLFIPSASLISSPSSHSSLVFHSYPIISDAVFIYDPRGNKWSTFVPLRFPRTYSSLFSINNGLFLVGGATRISASSGYQMEEQSRYDSIHGELRSVSAVDIFDGTEWKLQAELAVPRHGHTLSYLGTQLLIIGGTSTASRSAIDRVECFCSERKRWLSNMAFLPKPLCGHASIALPPATLM